MVHSMRKLFIVREGPAQPARSDDGRRSRAVGVYRSRAVQACRIYERDGRAMERVGSWLHQPAGLPMARDILGQYFMEVWLDNRERILKLHQHAEGLHDACDGECGEQLGHAGVAQVGEWHRLRHVLQHLVECQRVLLGSQAQATPVALRRRALKRMRALLADDAMQVERGSAPLNAW